MHELHKQLLPTKLYNSKRIKTCLPDDVMCQLCGKCPESSPHIFAGCSALAHSKYLGRHNSALKVLRDLKLIDSVPPWYSPVPPKSLYKSEDVQAHWDIPMFAEYKVRAKRVDARIVDHQEKTVTTLEMSCPWIQNWQKKDKEKGLKYGPLYWELKQQFKGYRITQYNIIITNNINKLKISIVLFPDVIKSTLQKFHIKSNTILNGEKVKNKI